MHAYLLVPISTSLQSDGHVLLYVVLTDCPGGSRASGYPWLNLLGLKAHLTLKRKPKKASSRELFPSD